MKIAVFSSKSYDREFLSAANTGDIELTFLEPRLGIETAMLAAGHDGVCCFVHDVVDAVVLERLASQGCRLVALRCAGFNNVDLIAAAGHGITVVRVPAYSPDAVAEFAVGLVLTLNRQYHRAYNRVRDGNFSLEDLVGFDVKGKTVGVVGTGKIGQCFARIMLGFGCRVLAHDLHPHPELVAAGVVYDGLDEMLAQADILSLHCPLLPETTHLINAQTLARMKRGVMLINTSRGRLIDTQAVIDAIKSGQVGAVGLDVYEEEEGIFFEDWSSRIVTDDVLMRLTTFPNVVVTSHQAFFTREALSNIAATTMANIREFRTKGSCTHAVHAQG
jgi:D-lactate dehydrogenase